MTGETLDEQTAELIEDMEAEPDQPAVTAHPIGEFVRYPCCS